MACRCAESPPEANPSCPASSLPPVDEDPAVTITSILAQRRNDEILVSSNRCIGASPLQHLAGLRRTISDVDIGPHQRCQSQRLWTHSHYCSCWAIACYRICFRCLQSNRWRRCRPQSAPGNREGRLLDSSNARKHVGISGCDSPDKIYA